MVVLEEKRKVMRPIQSSFGECAGGWQGFQVREFVRALNLALVEFSP